MLYSHLYFSEHPSSNSDDVNDQVSNGSTHVEVAQVEEQHYSASSFEGKVVLFMSKFDKHCKMNCEFC